MVSIEDIPLEQRWEIAAGAASSIPLAYDMAFREVLGDKYDEIERPIYIEAGKEIKNLASALELPMGNAREIGQTFGIIGTILNGPAKRECVVATHTVSRSLNAGNNWNSYLCQQKDKNLKISWQLLIRIASGFEEK
ncbi:MAG: hypothetical protein P1P80_02010 [ANME-2 cluster archaeon]|nr:hypothetical protein [ANME-2 cluster archaeon]